MVSLGECPNHLTSRSNEEARVHAIPMRVSHRLQCFSVEFTPQIRNTLPINKSMDACWLRLRRNKTSDPTRTQDSERLSRKWKSRSVNLLLLPGEDDGPEDGYQDEDGGDLKGQQEF